MNQQNNSFNSFVLGFIIGGILGVLYTPTKGEETRKVLKKLLEEWSKKGVGLSREVGELIAEVKEEAEPTLSKAEEVVEETKETITPIIEKITPIQELPPSQRPQPNINPPKRNPKFFQGV